MWVVALLRATTPQIGDKGVRTLTPGCTPRGRMLDAVLARPETAGKKGDPTRKAAAAQNAVLVPAIITV
ncbi:hypothetical protein NDU88_002324 [Pleurodeles waltl]|uniref:Uncharacterized protein n=1 Tax=Pleurodeles waltl TaxID=8319 RepID=A0AAV7LJZ4_PLEWA|nr:hypothetical protein NDU88_002324 [Pleurodeles waltl]